ncbi:MAG: hypothetical protein AAFP04_10260 [Myxococcota bacterium]
MSIQRGLDFVNQARPGTIDLDSLQGAERQAAEQALDALGRDLAGASGDAADVIDTPTGRAAATRLLGVPFQSEEPISAQDLARMSALTSPDASAAPSRTEAAAEESGERNWGPLGEMAEGILGFAAENPGTTGLFLGLVVGALFGPFGALLGMAVGFGAGYLAPQLFGGGRREEAAPDGQPPSVEPQGAPSQQEVPSGVPDPVATPTA